MSLQVNLSSPDITKAYQDVLNARGIDWIILTYEKASNDLRVQSTGNGLDDLEEEFSDGRYKAPTSSHFNFLTPSRGRIQYVFARVTDPNVHSTGVLAHSKANYLLNRPSYRSLYRSTGAEMVFQRRRRGYFIHIRPPFLASSVGPTS